MTAVDAIADARARNYRDLDVDGHVVDWSDEVDRTANTLRAFTYMTPEAAGSMVNRENGRAELAETWARLDATDRQLWRRRAAIALEISAVILGA